MKTIRLREMTDEEYKLVTQSKCPVCGSGEHARTSYGNITSKGRCVDVVCEECGAAWSIYAEGNSTVEQLRIPSQTFWTARDSAIYELVHMSDNKIKRSSKSVLISLAIDLGEDDIIELRKPEIADRLISIRSEALSDD